MNTGKYPLLLAQVKQNLADLCIGLSNPFRGVKNGDMLNIETGTPTLARFFVQFCYPSPPMRSVHPKDGPHFFCLRTFYRRAQGIFITKRLTHV